MPHESGSDEEDVDDTHRQRKQRTHKRSRSSTQEGQQARKQKHKKDSKDRSSKKKKDDINKDLLDSDVDDSSEKGSESDWGEEYYRGKDGTDARQENYEVGQEVNFGRPCPHNCFLHPHKYAMGTVGGNKQTINKFKEFKERDLKDLFADTQIMKGCLLRRQQLLGRQYLTRAGQHVGGCVSLHVDENGRVTVKIEDKRKAPTVDIGQLVLDMEQYAESVSNSKLICSNFCCHQLLSTFLSHFIPVSQTHLQCVCSANSQTRLQVVAVKSDQELQPEMRMYHMNMLGMRTTLQKKLYHVYNYFKKGQEAASHMLGHLQRNDCPQVFKVLARKEYVMPSEQHGLDTGSASHHSTQQQVSSSSSSWQQAPPPGMLPGAVQGGFLQNPHSLMAGAQQDWLQLQLGIGSDPMNSMGYTHQEDASSIFSSNRCNSPTNSLVAEPHADNQEQDNFQYRTAPERDQEQDSFQPGAAPGRYQEQDSFQSGAAPGSDQEQDITCESPRVTRSRARGGMAASQAQGEEKKAHRRLHSVSSSVDEDEALDSQVGTAQEQGARKKKSNDGRGEDSTKRQRTEMQPKAGAQERTELDLVRIAMHRSANDDAHESAQGSSQQRNGAPRGFDASSMFQDARCTFGAQGLLNRPEGADSAPPNTSNQNSRPAFGFAMKFME